MIYSAVESVIGIHCGPALAGIKPSNIVSLSKEKFSNISEKISELNNKLNKRGLFFETLCECDRRKLVMVFRKNKLIEHLKDKELTEFLKTYGYPVEEGLEKMIEYLKLRVLKENKFPHEIGTFLGYPLHDILGFLNHNNNLKFTGYWKVYDKENEARKLFYQYDRCKKGIERRITKGHSLVSLFSG